MKLIRKINAILICAIISLILVPVVIIALPICTIAELATFIRELFSDDSFYHNAWYSFVYKSVGFVKEVYRKMMDDVRP